MRSCADIKYIGSLNGVSVYEVIKIHEAKGRA